MATKKQGKRGQKHGRATRKPKTARRKLLRPDLARKFKNTLKSCGKVFAKKWVEEKLDKGEPVLKFKKLLD